jgi:tetratricopeptide (TPR) repeat protein
MTLARSAVGVIAAAVVVVAALALSAAVAAPFVPTDDAQILERLPEKSDPSLKDIKRMRLALAAQPDSLQLAAPLAKRAIEASRELGDPRYLGQAQAALKPWWTVVDPPPTALLLRATIKQSNHDFDGAISDLDRLIARNAADGQALLTRATVLTVQGKYEAGRADCTRLARLTVALVTAGCMAAPMSLSGESTAAYLALTDALAQAPNVNAGVREWALTLAAEIAQRRGDFTAADLHFRQAFSLDPHDPYLVAAYSDFLLARGRPAEVPPLIGDQTRNDNLLLRLALAEARLPAADAAFTEHRQELVDRFDAARQRGDTLHKREEARFRLNLEKDPPGALKLARENWLVQREPADLQILVDAATATGDRTTLDEARKWIAENHLEDVALAAVARTRE